MSSKMAIAKRQGRSGKDPRHVRLYHLMLASAAWRSPSANARAIYIEVAARYAGPGSNNGRIPYAVGEATEALNIGRATACRAFEQLQDRGFIVAVTKGAFSLKKKHATQWRLTEFGCDVTSAWATKDFMRWQPSVKNPSSVAELTVPLRNPIGFCGGTDVAKRARNGF